MNILTRLESERALTDAERVLADAILRDPERFLSENGKQVASRAAVSQATLYRLCEKLGCSGLADFKVQVAAALDDYRNAEGSVDVDFPVLPDQKAPEVMGNLAEDYRQTVAATRNVLDPAALAQAAALVAEASCVDVYATAGNSFFAQNFRFQMAEIGRKVNVPVDEYEQRLTATSSDPGHVAIVVSFGGRGLLARPIAQELERRGTPVILVCSADPTPLDGYASCRLAMSPHENHYRKVSSFATRLSLLYVLDALFACVFETDYEGNLERKVAYYEGIARMGSGLGDERA